MSYSEQEKLELRSGDEIRIIYKGQGQFGVQLNRKQEKGVDVELLFRAVTGPIGEVADYLKRIL